VNPGRDGKPVKCLKDGCYVFIFTHSHQDPSSTVLNVLEFLQTLAREVRCNSPARMICTDVSYGCQM